MFNKLRRRFVILATSAMFLLMILLILIMNIINYISLTRESDEVLNMLAQTGTSYSKWQSDNEEASSDFKVPDGMSPEVPYEARYFVVIVSEDGEIVNSDLSKIISVDQDSLEEYTSQVIHQNDQYGFVEQFRYIKSEKDDNTIILFLDCGRKLSSFQSFMWISIIVGFSGCLLLFIVFLFASGRIVKPIAESYEKQKRFITDAGHEIRTPLTIINANVDLLESDLGEQDEFKDIRQQTKRLTDLTKNLVTLSKMEESGQSIPKVETNISNLVLESANSFQSLAQSQNKSLEIHVQSEISMFGSPDSIRQLVQIVLENAIKYSPEKETITLDLKTQKKLIILSVFNKTDQKVQQNELQYIFDRFYRTDASRNSQTGGNGIGLSIAKAIVENHGGNITAYTKSGNDFTIQASFRLNNGVKK